MTIFKGLRDELLSGVEKPEDFFGDKGLMKELKVRLMERMLGAELTAHLGYVNFVPFAGHWGTLPQSVKGAPNGTTSTQLYRRL